MMDKISLILSIIALIVSIIFSIITIIQNFNPEPNFMPKGQKSYEDGFLEFYWKNTAQTDVVDLTILILFNSTYPIVISRTHIYFVIMGSNNKNKRGNFY